MLKKLIDKHVNSKLIMWIHRFLTGRRQYVRFKDCLSESKTINTGAPQGCVLSASLFTIYESDHETDDNRWVIIKYADDTVIIGLLTDEDDPNANFYTSEIERFNAWCKYNFLNLNVNKTKEMILDYRIDKSELIPIKISGQAVDVVKTYKYLGTTLDDKLDGDENINNVYKKANQRLYFVRKLRKCHIDKTIMSMFYKSVVESVLTFCMLCWYGGISYQARKKVERIVTSAVKLGCDAQSLEDLYNTLIVKKCDQIMNDDSHPLSSNFVSLPSKRRLAAIRCRTERFRKTFVPSAVRQRNS